MYLPPHFRVDDQDRLYDLIRRHPLGLLVTVGPAGLLANPIPMLLDSDARVLRGHVARANPVWGEFAECGQVLAVFQGHDHYVSPSWYETKRDTGKVVPTWNYAMVQIRGAVRAIEDPVWLRGLVTDLTDVHEAGRSQPWAVDDAPADYINAMVKAIVGFEIKIEKLEGKFKISQNRNAADSEGVAAGLEAQGDLASHDMAELMRNFGGKD